MFPSMKSERKRCFFVKKKVKNKEINNKNNNNDK